VAPAAAVLVRWRRTVAIASVRGSAGAWASPRAASTATLVFGRALPQIECENGDGFWRPSAFDGCPGDAGAPGEICTGAGKR
jgi:hypothetical protein